MTDHCSEYPSFNVTAMITRRVAHSSHPAEAEREREPPPADTEPPCCISRVHFATLASRLAQVAAKASADAIAVPAATLDRMEVGDVARLRCDTRHIMDAICQLAAGDWIAGESDEGFE